MSSMPAEDRIFWNAYAILQQATALRLVRHGTQRPVIALEALLSTHVATLFAVDLKSRWKST